MEGHGDSKRCNNHSKSYRVDRTDKDYRLHVQHVVNGSERIL